MAEAASRIKVDSLLSMKNNKFFIILYKNNLNNSNCSIFL